MVATGGTQGTTGTAMAPVGRVWTWEVKSSCRGGGVQCNIEAPDLIREPSSVVIGAASTLKVACRSPSLAIKSDDSQYHLPCYIWSYEVH
jgi:hypothetical protein